MAVVNFALQRVVSSVLLLVCVIVLNFLLIQLAPGDIAETMIGEMGGATAEILKQIRAEYGIDRSPAEQFVAYLAGILRGNLGASLYYGEPVSVLIWQRVPASLLLMFTALSIAIVFGTLFGTIAAQAPRGWFSHLVTVLSLAGYSAPLFWTGILLLIAFAHLFPVFPSFGMESLGQKKTAVEYVVDVARHLVLPAVTLASIYLAQYSRITRASMLEVLDSDYIRTGRGKGLSEGIVVYKHALKNALLPIVTIAGHQFGRLLGGAVVVETVFTWPGMGRLAFESILRRDQPLLLGILFCSTIIVITVNVVTDLSYRLLDPRIK